MENFEYQIITYRKIILGARFGSTYTKKKRKIILDLFKI